jgi:hypothetical protein
MVTFCTPPGGAVTAKSIATTLRASVDDERLTYETAERRNEAVSAVGVFSASNGRTMTLPRPKVL